jgi:hypothetical protein
MKMKRKEKDFLKDLTAEDLCNNPSLLPVMMEEVRRRCNAIKDFQRAAEEKGVKLSEEDIALIREMETYMAELDKCYEEYLQKAQQQAEKTGE